MKQLVSLLFLLLCCPFAMHAGRIVTDTIQSRVLGAPVVCNVYLPSHFEDGDRRYPIVYLLHGCTDDYTAWRDRGQMQMVADELIESGEAAPMVIVMPNAGGPDIMNVWNGYLNLPGWAYEDFFFTELLPTFEQRYRAIGDKAHRAIMGLSMGGGGSTMYAQRHPELFSACYAMSAWLSFDGDSDYPKGSRPCLLQEAVREHSALRFVENADPSTSSGQAILQQLRTVRWFFDCGDDDFLFDQSVRIHQLMRDRNVKDELRIRNGVHNWEYWHQAIRTALPFVSREWER